MQMPGTPMAEVESYDPRTNRWENHEPLPQARVGLGAAEVDGELLAIVGLTNLVARATASAAELSPGELAAGQRRLAEKVRRLSPRVVAGARYRRLPAGLLRGRAPRPARSPKRLAGAARLGAAEPERAECATHFSDPVALYRQPARGCSLTVK
jgi:TDG/mug DNA glycosylase family protein